MSTVIEKYIQTLKAYKNSGTGTIDDAIIIAETLLIDLETQQRRKDFEAGGKSGFNAASLSEFLTFEEYINQEE